MGTYVLIFVVIFFAFMSMALRRTERKKQRLRDQGIYPQEGQESEVDIDRLLQMGHKIEAIKVFRALHGVDLKEAKEAVEKRQREIGVR